MGNFPPYQTLSFNKPKCGACDNVYINTDELNVMYNGNYELISESLFNNNPFAILPNMIEIDSTNDPAPSGSVGGGDVLILYSPAKCYVYYSVDGLNNDDIIITDIEDGLCYVAVNNQPTVTLLLNQAINDTFGAETGATATSNGLIVSITDIPTGCHIYWEFNQLSMLTAIPQNQIGIDYFVDNMYYNPISKSMCFYNLSTVRNGIGFGTGQPKLFFNLLDNTGTIGLLIRTRYDITNNLEFDINVSTIFKDSGFGIFPSATYDDIVLAGETKQIEIIHIQPNTFTPTINGQIELQIEAIAPDSLINADNGICIDNFSYEALDFIDKVEKVDCNGVKTDADYTSEIIEENQLLTIDTSSISGSYYFIFTSVLGEIYTSNSYMFNNVGVCSKLLKIKWSHSCNYKGIDYSNFEFENEIYLKGYMIALPLEISEEKNITSSKGINTSIFSISQDAYELKIANYSEVIHKLLSHAFRHHYISIDDVDYIVNDSYSFTRTANTYIGKVNLLEKGTEFINSKCCD